MAINAYTGLMGSGKSYEVVSSVILDAVKAGRNVVSNIDGLDPEAIADYLVNKKKAEPEKLGKITKVTNADVTREGFFSDETKPDQPSVVQAGDLVCIDECWQFWGNEHKISEEHMRFFRMHRHYTNPQTGVACDLALMIQDLGTLNRKIRAVIELTSRTVKLKALGAPTRYRIELYEGNKIIKRAHVATFNKKYEKEIFPLYKSYAAGEGKEKAIDSRQNIFSNPTLWVFLILVPIVFAYGIWNTWKFFHPVQKGATTAAQPYADEKQASIEARPSQQGVSPSMRFSDAWRYAGQFRTNGEMLVVVSDERGRLRVESPSVFHGRGIAAIGTVDGQRVAQWSGGGSPQTQMPMPGPKDSK